jgi:hypothetical protein
MGVAFFTDEYNELCVLLPPNWVQERLSKSLGNKDAVHARQHVCLAPGGVLDPDIPSDPNLSPVTKLTTVT